MATTVWKGNLHLGFGLAVPVKLTAAARAEKISFDQVNPDTGAGVSTKLVDKSTEEPVKRSQLVKETSVNGTKVRVTADELKELIPADESVLEVVEFVKLKEIDPILFDKSYYVQPATEEGLHLFNIFLTALGASKYTAIGQVVIRQREHLVLLRRSKQGAMILHTLFYENEIREEPEQTGLAEIGESEFSDAKSFIRARSAKFEPGSYADRYLEALKQLLLSKADAPKSKTEVGQKLKGSLKKARTARRKARKS